MAACGCVVPIRPICSPAILRSFPFHIRRLYAERFCDVFFSFYFSYDAAFLCAILMARAAFDPKAANIWTARIIPLILVGLLAYVTWVFIGLLCGEHIWEVCFGQTII